MKRYILLIGVVLAASIGLASLNEGFIAITNGIAVRSESKPFVRLPIGQNAGAEITRNGYADDFEGSVLDDTLFESSSNASISSTEALAGSQSLLMAGSAQVSTVDFRPHFTDELVCIEFKLKIKTLPGSTTDPNFLGGDEIFQVRTDEVTRTPSSNPYSAKFSVLKGNTSGKIRFTGYDRSGAPVYRDTATDSSDETDFDADAVYDVKMIYSPYRMYIDINKGQLKTSYATARASVKNIRLYSRTGSEVMIDDFKVYGQKNTPKLISEKFQQYIDDGLFTGFVTIDKNVDGVAFSRMTNLQRELYGVMRYYSYQAGVWFDAYTDTRTIEIDYMVQENGYPSGWPTQFDVYVNGEQQRVSSVVTKKLKSYTFRYELPASAPVNNRLTVQFPATVNVAITDVRLDGGSVAVPVPKNQSMVVFGDSITEGSQCFSAAAVYANQVAMRYNMLLLNNAVSGSSFSSGRIAAGRFGGFSPALVLLAYGTNHFAGGGGDRDTILNQLEFEIPLNIAAIKAAFPEAKIVAITPIWRSDEAGVHFPLSDVIDKINEMYALDPEITVLDGYDYVPHDAAYFNAGTLKIHPNTEGHLQYATHLINDLVLKADMPLPSAIDWAALADDTVSP